MNKNLYPKKRGFTLIEILVVTALTAILSGIAIGYSNTGQQNIALFRDQAKVINAILRAKSLAVQSYVKGGAGCAYGVHFDQGGSFRIFRDLDELSERHDCSSANNRYSPNLGEDLNPPEISSLESSLSFAPGSILDISFIPPEPKVLIDQTSKDGKVVIQTKSGNNLKNISVNRFGQVNTQ